MITAFIILKEVIPPKVIREILLYNNAVEISRNADIGLIQYIINNKFALLNPNTEFLNACTRNNQEIVKFWLLRGASPTYQFSKAMRIASVNNNLNLIKFLHNSGSDIHTNNDILLHDAIKLNQTKIIKYVSQFNDPEIVLFLIFQYENYKILSFLKFNKKNYKNLLITTIKSKFTSIDLFIKIFRASPKMNTTKLLQIAFARDQTDIAKFLISEGADINVAGQEPLNSAIKLNVIQMASFLVENNIEISEPIKLDIKKNYTKMNKIINIFSTNKINSNMLEIDPISNSICHQVDILNVKLINKYHIYYAIEVSPPTNFHKIISQINSTTLVNNKLDFLQYAALLDKFDKFLIIYNNLISEKKINKSPNKLFSYFKSL